MNDKLDDIQKIAEVIFYTVSTLAVIKTTWGKKKHNSHKKKRKKKHKR